MGLPTGIIKAGNAVVTCLKANSPKILMGIGVVSSVAAVVDAVKQTPRAIDILEEHKEEIDKIKSVRDMNRPDYTDKDYKKDIFGAYVRTVGDLGKCYARPIVLELVGLGCFCGASRILSERTKIAQAAAAAAIDGAIADRKKVVEAIGEEKASEIFNGEIEKKVTKEIVDETGKKKKVTEKITVVDPNQFEDGYDFLWMEGDPGWDPSPELRTCQVGKIAEYYNTILYEKGLVKTVSLNDIRKNFKDSDEAFTEIGQIAGWDKDSDDQRIILRMKEVSIPDPENPNMYYDAVKISPNISGSIVKSFVR